MQVDAAAAVSLFLCYKVRNIYAVLNGFQYKKEMRFHEKSNVTLSYKKNLGKK